MFRRVRRIHFVGIGGAGMSGIAELLLNLGFEVTGSDIKDSPVIERLRRLGARVRIGHSSENLGDAEVVVYSSAVTLDNCELVEARKRGIPVIPRAEMLAELMRMKEGIAVAGSHGKTTITSLLAYVLSEAGLDPTAVIGGRLEKFGGGARLGQGPYLVAEADESDGSFLLLSPIIAVVTNIDPEHLDHYGTFERLRGAFASFVNRIPFYGVAVLGVDSDGVCDILPNIKKPFVTYGFSPQADFQVRSYVQRGNRISFVAYSREEGELAEVEFGIPGRHHALNALAALIVARELDVPMDVAVGAVSDFSGLHRRFEILGEFGGVLIVDDYG
ncbi:MAG TPA: UDP-N-acetylmuramate--L-alanine ligase, partial [Proteobacteria bacterium]|nr:UDP-N-acetylmuramate--L-alanine ligase [Pseudomonadota bacterium]